jgi:hypothetical protein
MLFLILSPVKIYIIQKLHLKMYVLKWVKSLGKMVKKGVYVIL